MATGFTIGLTQNISREFAVMLRARQALAKIEHLAQSDSSESVKLSTEAAAFLLTHWPIGLIQEKQNQ